MVNKNAGKNYEELLIFIATKRKRDRTQPKIWILKIFCSINEGVSKWQQLKWD